MTLSLGRFFLSVTELRKIKSSSTYSHPLFPILPQTFLRSVQDGYGLLSTTSQTLSVKANLFTVTLCVSVCPSLSWSL